MYFSTSEGYLLLNVKKNHPVFKKRLENAQEFSVRGGLYAALIGDSLRSGVMAGLMLCGDAVGYHGIIHAAISGHMVADVAVEAAGASDFSREMLLKYDKVRKRHPISRTKLGISFQNIDEEQLNVFLKEQGEAINKEMFKGLETFDY